MRHILRHCEEPLRRSNPESLRGGSLDCFAALAMTWIGRHAHSAAVSRCTLSAISFGTGAVHGAPRRRLTSTSIQ
ncbi:MAG: hypothetical protein EKK33_02710 [Bradyrhizobiaceae bacterium]|nr:MAG: hypothetical protein EKK33_02710 [Bradyrhizobiaceae bacterium]